MPQWTLFIARGTTAADEGRRDEGGIGWSVEHVWSRVEGNVSDLERMS